MMRETTDNDNIININNKNDTPTTDNKQLFISKLTAAVSNTAFQKQQAKRQTLGSLDILCGRTSTAFNHEGNKRFRQTISLNLQRYIDAPTRHAKSVVIASVVHILRHEMKARFVKNMTNNASGESYVELNKKECQEKVGHALRDQAAAAAATISSSSSTTTAHTKTTQKQQQQQQHEHVLSEKGLSTSIPTEISAPVEAMSLDPMCEAPIHQKLSCTTRSFSTCEREWIKIKNSTSRQAGNEFESVDYDIDPIPLSEVGENWSWSFLREMLSLSPSSSSSSSSSSSYYTTNSCSSSSDSAETNEDALDSQIYDLFVVSGGGGNVGRENNGPIA
jgi:phage baseplate assembly protein W